MIASGSPKIVKMEGGLFLHLRKANFNAFERSVEAIPEDHRRI
jgi:hypothetical protein